MIEEQEKHTSQPSLSFIDLRTSVPGGYGSLQLSITSSLKKNMKQDIGIVKRH